MSLIILNVLHCIIITLSSITEMKYRINVFVYSLKLCAIYCLYIDTQISSLQ